MAALHKWQIGSFSLISILGVIGNLIVCIVMFVGGKKLRSVPFNVYITSLAATDLSLAAVGIPIYVISKSSFAHPSGNDGNILCKIVTGNLLPFWLAGSSVYILVLISFERYHAIRDPFLARTRIVSAKTAIAITGALILGLLVQIPVMIGVEYTKENATIGNYCTYRWKSKSTTTLVYILSLTFQYVIPAAIFVVNFIRIRKCLVNLDDILKRQTGYNKGNQNTAAIRRKRKTIKTVFIIVLAFFICWTPNTIMFFVFQYAGVSSLPANSVTFEVSVILAFSSAWVNPMLYSFQSKEFRKHCKKLASKVYKTLVTHVR